jgi:hypothetical protein
MKKLLYANGDSFTFGMEILGDHSQIPENKNLSYPEELRKLLNIEFGRNEAYCGATNEFIFRKTIQNLLELESLGIDPKDVFVVIGWSSICRTEINAMSWIQNIVKDKMTLAELQQNNLGAKEFDNFGTFFISANAGIIVNWEGITRDNFVPSILEFLVEFMWRDDLEYEKWFVQQESLRGFLNNKGYDFLMLNSTQKFEYDKFNRWTKELMETFDTIKYIDPINFSMYDWVKENYPNEEMKFRHPSKKAHSKFAEYLYQYIIDNNIINGHEYV